jgi:hypothetical protein
MTDMTPSPAQPRRGFPWVGLMLAVIIAGGVTAYMIGGRYGALLALDYALMACALVIAVSLALMIVQDLRRR